MRELPKAIAVNVDSRQGHNSELRTLGTCKRVMVRVKYGWREAGIVAEISIYGNTEITRPLFLRKLPKGMTDRRIIIIVFSPQLGSCLVTPALT